MHDGILLKQENEIVSVATWMDLEIIITKRSSSQTKTDKYHMVSFVCGI